MTIKPLQFSEETSPGDIKSYLDILKSFIELDSNRVPAKPFIDQDRFHSLVAFHKLQAVFQSTSLQETVQPEIWTLWKNKRMLNLMKNSNALKTASGILNFLLAENIEFVAMRGLSLAHTLYPDPSMRPMHDVDALIARDNVEKFEALMEANGHEPTERLRSQLVYRIDNTVFEFHWSVLTAKRYRKALNSKKLISKKTTFTLGKDTIYSLASEDELIELVLHAFIHHDFNRLNAIIDIALVIKHRNLDWDYIIDFCQKTKLSRLFFLALSFVNDLFDLGKESELNRYNIDKSQITKYYDTYTRLLFGGFRLKNYLNHKASLLYVAESFPLKIRQFLRFFSRGEFLTFRSYSKSLFKADKHPKG